MTLSKDLIVLDLEIARSPKECRFCGNLRAAHHMLSGGLLCPRDDTSVEGSTYTELGWHDKAALGLSIGGYYSFLSDRIIWFCLATLAETVQRFVRDQPLLVSFNGKAFDFAVMRAVLLASADAAVIAQTGIADHAEPIGPSPMLIPIRTSVSEGPYIVPTPVLLRNPDGVEEKPGVVNTHGYHGLCDAFKTQCTQSFDLLESVWLADPGSKHTGGLNTLRMLCQTNSLPYDSPDAGATVPALWQDGEFSRVLNHCADDIYMTRNLCQHIMATGTITRSNGAIVQVERPPGLLAWWLEWVSGRHGL